MDTLKLIEEKVGEEPSCTWAWEIFLNRTPMAYALRSTVPPLKGCAGLFVLHVSVGYSKSSVDNVQLIAPGIFAVHTSLPKESLKGTNNYRHYRCRKREKIQVLWSFECL